MIVFDIYDVMDLIALVYRFEQYLKKEYGDDHPEVILTQKFRELLQTKVKKRTE